MIFIVCHISLKLDTANKKIRRSLEKAVPTTIDFEANRLAKLKTLYVVIYVILLIYVRKHTCRVLLKKAHLLMYQVFPHLRAY